jgi:short-subunit dehydrogenase
MDSLNGKWALITGASSGFGLHFAALLAARSVNLVLVARRLEPMDELAETLRRTSGVQVIVEPVDLSMPGAATDLKNRIDRHGIEIEVLVNNAGRGLYGDFLDQPLDTVRTMIDLNLTVVTELTHLFARDMVRRKTGHILLIASILGYQPTPGYVVYGATKAYVLLFGESLHAELKKHNVNVTVLSPGPAETSFAHVAGQRNTFVLRALMMEPEAVARTGIRAMLQRRSSVVAGFLSKLVIVSNRLTPRFVQGLIMQRALSGSS